MKAKDRINDPEYFFFLRQENIYWDSVFLNYKWYREAFGGKWYLMHFKRQSFCNNKIWSKRLDVWSVEFKILIVEQYSDTNVDTKWKLFKQLSKQLWKKLN